MSVIFYKMENKMPFHTMDGCFKHANLIHRHLQCQMSVVYICQLQALRLHKSCHTDYIIS